jgi:hypothetical protein
MTAPRYSRITGTGSYLPDQRLTNADLAAQLAARGVETSDEWIVERTGIRARHFAADDQNASDLARCRRQMRRRGRPHHLRHINARHGVSIDCRDLAAQVGRSSQTF